MSGDDTTYPDTRLFIGNAWLASQSGETYPIVNPATGEVIGRGAKACRNDLELAVSHAAKGFEVWRDFSPYERSKVLRRAADLLRQRQSRVARLISLEMGKPLPEAAAEVNVAADTIEWFAEEGRRTYGRIVPSRSPATEQKVVKSPVGPVAVFTPWNFPLNQAARKVAAALAAGCSVVAKPAEEAPACIAELATALMEAGLPSGVLNMVLGVPSEISEFLIAHPQIRKISFTGSTVVGKKLAALAGEHMKRATMELGGHAPVLIFGDADPVAAANVMARAKFRNSGQICVAPTRFIVHRSIYGDFVDAFASVARSLTIGDGLAQGTDMGPLASERRLAAMEVLVRDAVDKGAELKAGGRRHGNVGYYFEPTVLTNVPISARAMNEEPFGPLALIRPFETTEEAVAEANRLPYGLAAFAYTQSTDIVSLLGTRVEAGMLSINDNLLALPEVPFGGLKDSGYGSEGGSEAMEAYLSTRLIKVTTQIASG